MSAVIFDARQSIRRGTEELARVFTRVVCLTVDGRPARLPKDLRELFLPLLRPAGDGPAPAAASLSGTATRG
jgi:acyl-CoA thioesterase FadM